MIEVSPPAQHIKVQRLAPVIPNTDTGWSLRSLSGSREGVCRAIDESNIPARWKAVLKDELAAIPAEFNFIRSFDAHCQIEKGHFIFHSHLTPSVALV